MLIIKSYLFKRYAKLYFLVFFTLVMLLWLTQVISIIEFLALKGLGFLDFLGFSLLLVPRVMEGVIPLVGVVVSTILSLELVGKRELFVLKSSGLSVKEILRPISLFGYFVLCFSLLVHFFISPLAYSKYQDTKESIKNSSFSFSFRKNSIMKLDNETILYSEKINNKNSNIVIYQLDEEKESVIYAKKGDMIKLGEEAMVNLEKGGAYSRDRNKENFNILSFDQFTLGFDMKNDGKIHSEKSEKTKAYTAIELIEELVQQDSQNKLLGVEIFRRISWTLLGTLLPILVFSICISGDFDRKYGIKKRILGGIVLTIILVATHFILKNNFYELNNIGTLIIIFFAILLFLWKIDVENNILLSKRSRHKIS